VLEVRPHAPKHLDATELLNLLELVEGDDHSAFVLPRYELRQLQGAV
jgi:hypothetical protein